MSIWASIPFGVTDNVLDVPARDDYTAAPIGNAATVPIDVATCRSYHDGVRLLIGETVEHADPALRFITAEAILLEPEVRELIKRLTAAITP